MRFPGKVFIASAAIVSLVMALGCGGDNPQLKGQANADIIFYGMVVDEVGKGLPNVTLEYQCEAFPKDWSFEKRDEALIVSTVRGVSDQRGRFSFAVNGHVLKRLKVIGPAGYRHLYETHQGEIANVVIPSTYGYLLSSWGNICYRSDPDNPAVFVFVRDGVHEVTATPCRGGFAPGRGQSWERNIAAWPREPSLDDVVYKPPTTQPSTFPSAR